MKVILLLASFVALCSANANLLVPGDNTGYVEGVSRYIWMPDGEGEPHLVDLHKPADEEYLNARNGNENGYWLFTRQNPHHMQPLHNGNAHSIRVSHYRGHRQTVVVVHGWNNNGNSHMNHIIRDAFLAVMDCNVIVLDWHRLANRDYVTAMRGVPDVGNHLGDFINFLFNTAGGNFDHLHLVGFSLGAHVVGNAGRRLGGRVRRITGLDPAGPSWGGNPNALNVHSARYVESIHTDGRLLGIMDPISHADFYPNGGRNPQPGCAISTCSHGRAPELFAATVHHAHLFGKQCANIWEAELTNCHGHNYNMGNGHVEKWGQGLYGLLTRAQWPF